MIERATETFVETEVLRQVQDLALQMISVVVILGVIMGVVDPQEVRSLTYSTIIQFLLFCNLCRFLMLC